MNLKCIVMHVRDNNIYLIYMYSNVDFIKLNNKKNDSITLKRLIVVGVKFCYTYLTNYC